MRLDRDVIELQGMRDFSGKVRQGRSKQEPGKTNALQPKIDESPRQFVKERRKSFTDSKEVEPVDYEYSREGAAKVFFQGLFFG